ILVGGRDACGRDVSVREIQARLVRSTADSECINEVGTRTEPVVHIATRVVSGSSRPAFLLRTVLGSVFELEFRLLQDRLCRYAGIDLDPPCAGPAFFCRDQHYPVPPCASVQGSGV